MRVMSWLLSHFLTWTLAVPLFLWGRRSDGGLTSSLEGHLREGTQEGKSGRLIKRCGALGHAHNADLIVTAARLVLYLGNFSFAFQFYNPRSISLYCYKCPFTDDFRSCTLKEIKYNSSSLICERSNILSKLVIFNVWWP